MDNATSDHTSWLRQRWSTRFPGLPSIGASVIERYAEPTRVYHDVRHLAEVLRHVEALAGESKEPSAVELGAWFHDAVYDVHRQDNEDASAELARRMLGPHLAADQVGEVERLVLLTRDHAVARDDVNGAVLCDSDLAILASEPVEYADYTRRVRREYAHVPDEAFRTGRAEVLRKLLALPQLFHTTFGAAHWEAPARANLTSELLLLLHP